MKFDAQPHEAPSQKPKITPQSAMDDYFADMFGGIEDPLKALSGLDATKEVIDQPQDSSAIQAQKQVDTKREVNVAPVPQKKKTADLPQAFTRYEEPEVIVGKISPLIIPAAFPKLAPVVAKKEKLIGKELTSPAIPVSVTTENVKPKESSKIGLDAKTALAMLEKKRSSLSAEQIKRLEAKLKQLSIPIPQKEIQVTVQNESVKTKPALKETLVEEMPLDSVKPKEAIATKSETKTAVEGHHGSPGVPKIDRPAWSNNRFECLIFSVAGLKLAVPLISLGAIYKIEKEYTPIVGRAEWFMGLYQYLDRNVRVIDTAQWVMPERCSPEVRQGYKFIIRLGGNDWGMACDAVHESIQLYPDQVKWRTERTKRAWLFGTVIDHMCALIDAEALSTMLEQQSTKLPRKKF